MTNEPVRRQRVDSLSVEVWSDPASLGAAAARAVSEAIAALLDRQERARVVFAAAPSQHETLRALRTASGLVDWSRVDAFHMDEYVGLPAGAPQRFGNWLRREILDAVPVHAVNLIDPAGGAVPEAEAQRYGTLVAAAPIDIVLAGIGANGHLAFNDPPADFGTADRVQLVQLDRASRAQQVDEGLFPSIEEVPTHAWTLTVPCLLSAESIFCMVSGGLKRTAVARALSGEVGPDSPASALRTHPDARLFVDQEAIGDA